MSQAFGLGKLIGLCAHRSELESLRTLVVEEGDLLITGSSAPTFRHEVRQGTNLGVVDAAVGGGGNPLFLIRCPRTIGEHAVTALDGARRRLVEHHGGSSKTSDHIHLCQQIGPCFV